MAVATIEIESASAKEQGLSLENELIEAIDEVEDVPDEVAEWHDAATCSLWIPSMEIPFVGLCLVESGVPVEIKGAQLSTSNGGHEVRGRFYIKRGAHDRLRAAGGVYLFAVYSPGRDSTIHALLVVAASTMESVLEGRWYDVGGQRSEQEVAKVGWPHIISPAQAGVESR